MGPVRSDRGQATLMGVYLIDHPPKSRQYRSPRRATPSGLVVVHTAENTPDTIPVDGGAENVASFIANRSDPGSYHVLADSDTWIQVVRWDDEAFGDATGSNPYAMHVSAATQAHRWDRMPDWWVEGTIQSIVEGTAAYARWLARTHGTVIPARRVTRAESENGVAGFISHAERDPARRTDPGAGFPWDRFLAAYDDEVSPVSRGQSVDEALEHARAGLRTAQGINRPMWVPETRAAIQGFRQARRALRSIDPL